MKEFLSRNKPVFKIGAFTLVLFIILIAISQAKKHQPPRLVPVNETNQINEEETVTEEATEAVESTQSSALESKVDEQIGVLQIEYTENGFSPKNTKAVKGQLVRWINQTDKDIYLEQLTPVYEELKTPVLIKAHEVFEFRLAKDKLWTYREKETKSFGSIFVLEMVLD